MSCHGLKMAYRNLLKYKLQSVICVLGLAGGLSCFTVCNYMLREELAWNKQLPHYGETYKLVTIRENGEVDGLVSLDLAEQLKQEFPEIEKSVYYVGMSGVSDKLCVVGQENGKQTAAKAFFVLTDSSFFDFYDFRLTAGNGEKLKKQPDVLILTSEGADKIFGTSEAVGKSFTEVNDFENTEHSWTVAAMMENFPHRTDFQYGDGVILNSDVLRQARYRDYVFVYYRLREGTSYELLNRKIGVYMEKHPEWRGNTPLTVKVYPYKDYKKLTGKPLLSKAGLIFSGIGLLVLLTALFNFLLFTAGRMFNRRKELGIRELHGATSGRLLQLFMVEITLTLLITGVIAAAMLELISMYFAGEWTYYMNFSEGGSWVIKMGGDLAEYLIGVWLLMLAVGYGIIRQVRQATMLRNLQGGGIAYRARMQTVLLGIQLVICMFLIGLSWFMQNQQKALESQMAGGMTRAEMERIYAFNLNGESLEPIRKQMRDMLAANPYAEEWCRSGTGLLAPWMIYPKSYRIEGVKEEKEVTLNYNCVDPNYTDFIHAKMAEGRFFKTGEPYVMVVNRAFADWLGENPIGKSVTIDGMMGVITYRIIGIMENLLPVGYELRIIPGIYLPFPEGYINETLYVKFRPGYVQQGIQPLKDKVQAQLSSFTPLYIENLWVDMEGYLSKVIELGSMIFWLAVFCILISALGVYSAMMLAVEKRSREMAIRKINGATLTDIAGIFCLHYLKLLIFAACIAFPLIYGTMHRWLEEYSHRITLRPDVFAAIFILMMIIMLLTIGSQLLKIIRVNPTEVLKND